MTKQVHNIYVVTSGPGSGIVDDVEIFFTYEEAKAFFNAITDYLFADADDPNAALSGALDGDTNADYEDYDTANIFCIQVDRERLLQLLATTPDVIEE